MVFTTFLSQAEAVCQVKKLILHDSGSLGANLSTTKANSPPHDSIIRRIYKQK
jgi:hypothetical protein